MHDSVYNSYLFVNRKEIYKFKINNNKHYSSHFCLGSISSKFDSVKSEEVSSKGNVYDFSCDFNAIDKFNILNIHKYLITKNNMK